MEKAVRDLGLIYPMALDNDYAIWNGFHNQYWPAHYFIDAAGKVRRRHFGEGQYEESERVIQELLSERHAGAVPTGFVRVDGQGALAPSLTAAVQSPETYLGYSRSENRATVPALEEDQAVFYRPRAPLARNQWGLDGLWTLRAGCGDLGQGAGQDSLPVPRARLRTSSWGADKPRPPSLLSFASTAARPKRITAPTWTPKAGAGSPASGFTSSCAKKAAWKTIPSRSSSSSPAPRPSLLPSGRRRRPENY